MPYDLDLADRIRHCLLGRVAVVEKKMFGGLAMMAGGHMLCGVADDRLMLRVGPEKYDVLLTQPHARPMDLTGKPLRGLLLIDAAGVETREQVGAWLTHACDFVLALPPKA